MISRRHRTNLPPKIGKLPKNSPRTPVEILHHAHRHRRPQPPRPAVQNERRSSRFLCGFPFAAPAWQTKTAARLGLESTHPAWPTEKEPLENINVPFAFFRPTPLIASPPMSLAKKLQPWALFYSPTATILHAIVALLRGTSRRRRWCAGNSVLSSWEMPNHCRLVLVLWLQRTANVPVFVHRKGWRSDAFGRPLFRRQEKCPRPLFVSPFRFSGPPAKRCVRRNAAPSGNARPPRSETP